MQLNNVTIIRRDSYCILLSARMAIVKTCANDLKHFRSSNIHDLCQCKSLSYRFDMSLCISHVKTCHALDNKII